MEASASGAEFDDVAAPVALEVDGKAQEGRGHELRLPERARPGSVELVGRHVAAVDDLERRHQFGAEIVGAPAEAGKRGQRLHERAGPHLLAEIQLHAPDRRQYVAADPELLLRAEKRARLAPHRRFAVGDPVVAGEGVDIVPDRRLELRLLALEIEHFHVRLESVEGDAEGVSGNPVARGLGFERTDAGGEVSPRRGRHEHSG